MYTIGNLIGVVMNNKEKYINDIMERFDGKAQELLLRQVEMFYQNDKDVKKNKYKVGEEVFLRKELLSMEFLED